VSPIEPARVKKRSPRHLVFVTRKLICFENGFRRNQNERNTCEGCLSSEVSHLRKHDAWGTVVARWAQKAPPVQLFAVRPIEILIVKTKGLSTTKSGEPASSRLGVLGRSEDTYFAEADLGREWPAEDCGNASARHRRHGVDQSWHR
jgi:hypothetical protein